MRRTTINRLLAALLFIVHCSLFAESHAATDAEGQAFLNALAASYTPWSSVQLDGKLRMDKLPVSPSVRIYMEKGKKLYISVRAPFVGDDGGVTNVLSNDALFKIQSDVIRKVAAGESAVFVGRCADYILRENPRCVNVFITADDEDRCRRICARQGCTPAEAQALMERVDARRASYYNYYSSRTWGVASTYHLCVSSSVLGDEGTADFILEFAARKLHEKM
mgnify:FL=1